MNIRGSIRQQNEHAEKIPRRVNRTLPLREIVSRLTHSLPDQSMILFQVRSLLYNIELKQVQILSLISKIGEVAVITAGGTRESGTEQETGKGKAETVGTGAETGAMRETVIETENEIVTGVEKKKKWLLRDMIKKHSLKVTLNQGLALTNGV